jgi:hypothetical protein
MSISGPHVRYRGLSSAPPLFEAIAAKSESVTHASAAVTVATVIAPASAVMTVPRNDVRAADRDTEHSTNYGPGRSCNHGSQACADASALQRTCLRYEGHQRQH